MTADVASLVAQALWLTLLKILIIGITGVVIFAVGFGMVAAVESIFGDIGGWVFLAFLVLVLMGLIFFDTLKEISVSAVLLGTVKP